MNNCYLSEARISLVMRKSVFRVTDQVGNQTACLVLEATLEIHISDQETEVSCYLGSSRRDTNQTEDVHVDLHLSHSHMQDTLVFSAPDPDRNADSINNISRFS